MLKRDFTLKVYEELLKSILSSGHKMLPFKDYLEQPEQHMIVILRHDVDKKPENSFKTAQIENALGITGTYYFRIVRESFNETIIEQIIDLGHEIGYHYEDLTLARGDHQKARELFVMHLETFRERYPVSTICMHGSPMSKWDNRDLWEGYSYKDHGIIGEPYFDLDYKNFLYFTDTGRRWNGKKYSIRDKVNSNNEFNIKTTFDLIERIKSQRFLNKNMLITVHPQRWTNNLFPWTIEYFWQNMKNRVKKIFT